MENADDEEDDDAHSIEDQIEEILRAEFPSEDDNEEREDEETEDAATERLEREIEERFGTDENNLVTVTVQGRKTFKVIVQIFGNVLLWKGFEQIVSYLL